MDDGDEKIDEIKINYMLNILKIGLEIELDQGVMKSNGHLIFVKVHAPDSIIQQYGELFRTRKQFKDSHVEFINASNWYLKILSKIVPFYFRNNEREWVKLVRKQYPGSGNYSTLERSDIVYRMLMLLPFGSNENYVGLERLIQKNIILDAYALHDGPYFFVPNQDVARVVNARQILYNNWMGADMLLKEQPVSLLQEYFGEKIAFYFAFCEYFDRALLLLSSAGAYILYAAYKENVEKWGLFKRRGIERTFCDSNFNFYSYICPRCRDFDTCPFYRTDSACHEVFVQFGLETPNMLNFYLTIIAWGTIFVLLWRRREHYLSWLWELDINGSNVMRPGYKVNMKGIRRSKVTGLLRSFDTIGSKILRILQSILLISIFLAVVFPVTVLWAQYQFVVMKYANENKLKYPHFSALAILSVMYSFWNLMLEKAIEILSHIANRLENHKTQDNYEKSLIFKQFGASFAFNFSYFYFLAFIKGRLYTYPYDNDTWNIIAGLGMMNCGVFTCIDEVGTLLCVYIVFRKIILKVLPGMLRYKTDYNISRSANKKIPCWEREYRLKSVNEQFVIDLFKDLAMQFALTTLFAGAFPLAPLFILIANILIVRSTSWYLLLGCRRPLLCNAVGFTNWRIVMFMIAVMSALTNVLMMVLNTRVAAAKFYNWFGYQYNTEWVPFFQTNVSTKRYLDKDEAPGKAFKSYSGDKPSYCLYLGRFQIYKGNLTYNNYDNTIKGMLLEKLVMCQHLVILLVVLIVLFIPTQPKDIQETAEIEDRIKNQCYIRQKRKGL